MSESWLNDSWESAFLLQAHHDLISVHRRTRSPHPEAHEETCHDQAEMMKGGGRWWWWWWPWSWWCHKKQKRKHVRRATDLCQSFGSNMTLFSPGRGGQGSSAEVQNHLIFEGHGDNQDMDKDMTKVTVSLMVTVRVAWSWCCKLLGQKNGSDSDHWGALFLGRSCTS